VLVVPAMDGVKLFMPHLSRASSTCLVRPAIRRGSMCGYACTVIFPIFFNSAVHISIATCEYIIKIFSSHFIRSHSHLFKRVLLVHWCLACCIISEAEYHCCLYHVMRQPIWRVLTPQAVIRSLPASSRRLVYGLSVSVFVGGSAWRYSWLEMTWGC
jgi:hypothetical protein